MDPGTVTYPLDADTLPAYYWWRPRSRCYLVFAYPKTARADLTRRQLRELAAVMDEEVGNG